MGVVFYPLRWANGSSGVHSRWPIGLGNCRTLRMLHPVRQLSSVVPLWRCPIICHILLNLENQTYQDIKKVSNNTVKCFLFLLLKKWNVFCRITPISFRVASVQSHESIQECMGVTKARGSLREMCFAKVPARFCGSHSYLTGVTTAKLQWHLSNMNVISIKRSLIMLRSWERWRKLA